ncbi:stress responsive A/B barrel domain protein [Aspergillus pseudoustus]|uniref:Stress responsive A/B barrel domain protein n=1 Tax=Aspergillus pseudoustus TaxID=1810923 RepID=A0ABR4IU39_9EURO
MFKFRTDVSSKIKETFLTELRKLKALESVKAQRLVVGGPSLTDPIERSKGFELAIMSLHEDLAALERYQGSEEHHWVTTTYLWPYKEDVVRFDFEVAPEDEWMWKF